MMNNYGVKYRMAGENLAGNSSSDFSDDCFTIWVMEDSSAPSVTLTCPPDGAGITGTYEVKADASDCESGIQKVVFKYSLDGITWNNIGEDCSYPYSVLWDTCEINADDVMVKAIATNGVGLYSYDVNECIMIDNTCPTVCIDEIDCTTNHPVITGTAFDALSGVDCVKIAIENDDASPKLYWNGGDWVTTKTWLKAEGTTCWSFDTCGVNFATDTCYKIYAKAIDKAGIESEKAETGLYLETDGICLYPDWNFISLPNRVTCDYDTFGELLCGVTFTDAYGYDPCDGWIHLCPDSPVKTLSAYWIYVPKNYAGDGNQIKFRYDPCGKTVPATKELKGDAWNAVGPTGGEVGDWVAVYETFKSIEGSWATLICWSNENQRYETTIYEPGYESFTGVILHETVIDIPCGDGYWIWISNPHGDILSEVIESVVEV